MNWNTLVKLQPRKSPPIRETDDEFLKKLQEENRELERQLRIRSGTPAEGSDQKSAAKSKQRSTQSTPTLGTKSAEEAKTPSPAAALSGKIIKNAGGSREQSETKGSTPPGPEKVKLESESEKGQLIQELKGEIARLKGTVRKSPEKIKHLEGETEKLHDKILTLENANSELLDSLRQKEVDNSDLRKENVKLAAALQKQKVKYKQLKTTAQK